MKKALVLIVVVGICEECFAAGGKAELEILKGIDSLSVLVEDLSDHAHEMGLTKDRLRAFTEHYVESGGIAVVSPEDSSDYVLPCLYVNLNLSVLVEMGLVYYNLSVNVQQPAILMRNLRMYREQTESSMYLWTWAEDWPASISVPTWGKAILGGAGTLRFVAAVEESLSYLLDMFIMDYLAANPVKHE